MRQAISWRDQRFVAYWQRQRSRKWRYVLVHGLLQGLFVGVLSYLMLIRFDFQRIEWLELLVKWVVFSLGGMVTSNWHYNIQDKRFLEVQSRIRV